MLADCATCNGVEFNAAHGTVLCLFCGTIAPAGLYTAQVVAIDGQRVGEFTREKGFVPNE